MKRTILAVTLVAVLSIALVGTALATWRNYNVIVPKFGGSAYSAWFPKLGPSGYWGVNSAGVGGGYQVYATMDQGGNMSLSYLMSTGTQMSNPYTTVPAVGSYVRLRVSNKTFTAVDVQAYGEFEPDY